MLSCALWNRKFFGDEQWNIDGALLRRSVLAAALCGAGELTIVEILFIYPFIAIDIIWLSVSFLCIIVKGKANIPFYVNATIADRNLEGSILVKKSLI
jgi:hypothetical protein